METQTPTREISAEELEPGARNAIRTCLKVRPQEHVTIVTDQETRPIAESLADQVRAVGAPLELHVMEDYGARPMTTLPEPLRQASGG